MKKRILALLLVLAMGLSLAACSAPAADPSDDPSADPSESVSPSGSETIEADLNVDILSFANADLAKAEDVIVINGETVSTSLFCYLLALSSSYFESTYYYYGYTVADYGAYILNDTCSMAAYYTLMRQKATELGCPLTDEQQADIAATLQQDNEADPGRLEMYGLNSEDISFIYSLELLQGNLEDALYPTVTEEDLNDYVYQVKHILVMTKDASGAALEGDALAEKTALANDILAQLQACATQEELEALFDELMNEYSEDGRDENGELYYPDGYTTVPGEMVQEFEDASLALEIGGLSGLVESTYGYHIILRGEVEDIESYTDGYKTYQFNLQAETWMGEADIEVSEVLNGLDVGDFYERYIAWQQAYVDQNSVDITE